jgi:GTPase
MENDKRNQAPTVILVDVVFQHTSADALSEFQALAKSAGMEIVATMTSTRRAPDAKYFIGSGKADELKSLVQATDAHLVIFNHSLTPGQERNLERLLKCRILDRTGLILDIFAQRARSFEGKLQVELALLKHQSTRLVRSWTHLERQRGGIGLRGGPGETQLEVDRRLIRTKIKQITERLDKLRQQRALSRRSRRKAIVPTIALVGYTNAGKSTLFNQLTGASVYAANQLFATLDSTLRRVEVKEYGPLIFADTVGFIRHLPHDLIEAFHATLEEVSEADLLLHVIDASGPEKNTQIEEVEAVLKAIHAEQVPCLQVYNKMDELPDWAPSLQRDERGQVKRVFLSAKTGEGILELIQAIAECLGRQLVRKTVVLSPNEMKLRAALFAKNAVITEEVDEAGNYHLQIQLAQIDFDKLFR